VTGCTAIVDFGGIEPYPDGGASKKNDAGRSAGEDAPALEGGGISSVGGGSTGTGGTDGEGALGTGSRGSEGGASDAGGRSAASGGKSSSSSGGANGNGGRTGAGGKASTGGTLGVGGAAGAATGGVAATGGALGNGGRTGAGGTMSSGGCSASKWYADSDADQFGDDTQTTIACTPPAGHWVLLGGDCNDGNADVHPATSSNPVAFHGSGYANTAGQESFDYDCSGNEDGDPSQQEIAACSGLTACDQGVQGYVARSDRAGASIDSYCGSTTTVTCSKLLNLLICGEASRATSQPPRRCR
jgi:hypothetical protein